MLVLVRSVLLGVDVDGDADGGVGAGGDRGLCHAVWVSASRATLQQQQEQQQR